MAQSQQSAEQALAEFAQGGWDGRSARPSISANGRAVALSSVASNMVADDTNAAEDIFVYDFGSLRTRRISVTSGGAQANGPSSQPSISGDGRYVAFRSSASNLLSGDSNDTSDIFVFDRSTGTVKRVSVDGTGGQANGPSSQPSISGDGRYVAFRSSASNLVSGDTNAADDIFVRDRTAGTTTRVSVDSAGAQANAPSDAPAISGDGKFVAFGSSASNLVGGDTNSAGDVFLRSLAGATTTRVSVTANGNQASGASGSPSVSFDATRIAFQSIAGLASGDANAGSDIYVRDRVANTTTWATEWVKTGWWGATGAGTSPSISGDGRYVAFALDADVHIGDTNLARDIYEYDLATGAWAHISRDDLRGGGNNASDFPSLSSDGTYAAFESSATNFHLDTNGFPDAFVHKWTGVPTTATQDSTATSSVAATDDAAPPAP